VLRLRWKRTTMDGFGRVTRVESGNGAVTNAAVSQVDTQYAPCGCSPLGKMWRVSLPYRPELPGTARPQSPDCDPCLTDR
jgi:hypothetical protein